MSSRGVLLGGMLLLSGLGSVLAYQRDISLWEGAETTFYSGMSDEVASGLPFANAFRAAMASWTQQTEFSFKANNAYRDPCAGYSRRGADSTFPTGDGDGRNGAGFSADVCGNDFGENVLAITLNLWRENSLGFAHLTESDIVFNAAYDWDVYAGPRREAVDFYRVALHELGHALGLKHELHADAIMNPRIGTRRDLTPDDIAGVSDIYALKDTCAITALERNVRLTGALNTDDCRIRDLYSVGSDESRVDVYRLNLEQRTPLSLALEATALDPVLLIVTPRLKLVDAFSDTSGGRRIAAHSTLDAGEYLVLVNTFTEPRGGKSLTGEYALTIADAALPGLGAARASAGQGDVSRVGFQGGASKAGSQQWQNRFGADDSIDVSARITVDPAHAGQAGSVYIVAILSNGRAYMKTATGFVPFSGTLSELQPWRSGVLRSVEEVEVISGLRGSQAGLAGLGFTVFIGYASGSQPSRIYYPASPLSFSIEAL